VTLWGDSLTQAGMTRTRLLELLPPGTVVNNRGIGGQTSTQIAARQGGIPAPVTLVGDTIPASGPVNVVSPPPVKFLFSYSGPNNKQGARSLTGTLAGIPGTMSMAAVPEFGVEQYVFTRTTSGSAVAVAPGTPFIFDDALAQRANTQVLWTGRNDLNGPIVANTVGMVNFLSPYTPRFLVLSPTTATTEVTGTQGHTWATKAGADLFALYGDRYVDIRRHLIDNGLALAGITPTPEDNTAIAGDTIPPSLMNPGDSVHFNDTAQRIIADFYYARMQTKGWY
jgi:hypothetical protein